MIKAAKCPPGRVNLNHAQQRNRLVRFVAFTLAIGASRCFATDADPDSLLNMNLDQLGSIKVDTVFAASKFTQKVTDAPSSVTIVTRDEIEKFGYRTLGEIIRSVRSFDVTYDRDYSYTGVRGFNGLGDYGARVLLLIDGHRTNEPIFNTSAVGTDALLDVDLIDHVEFIRGPGSAIYGSNAFFAVINVVTRTGAAVGGAEVSGSYATYDTFTGRFTYGKKFSNGIELMVSGTGYHSDGPERIFYQEFNTPQTNFGTAENRDGDQFWSLFGSISWGDFTLEGGFDDRRKDVPTAAFGGAFNRLFRTFDNRGFVDLRYAHETENGWQLAGRLFYDTYDYHTSEDFAGDPGVFIVNNDWARARWWGAEASVGRTFFDRIRLTLGTEVRIGYDLEIGNYDVKPYFLYQNTTAYEDVFGLYAQSDTELLKNLRLSAGLRWDHYNTFGDTVNPRLGMIYNPWKQTTLKLLFGTAFRAPNTYEEKLDSPAYEAAGHLNPEHVQTYEAVVEQYFLTNWRASASGFYNHVTDLIDSEIDPSNGLLTFQNLNNVEMRGAEFEVEGKWDNGLLLRTSYTHQDVEDSDTGQRLPNAPANVVKTHISVPLWRDKIFGSLEFLYTSDRLTLRSDHTGNAWLVNTTLFSRELLPRLECSVSIYNLFDQKYWFVGGAEHLQDRLEQDGRSFRVKLTYTF